MIEHLNTLHDYAIATICHWLICGFAGWITVNKGKRPCHKLPDVPMPRTVAVCILAFWISYELSEFARIHDRVEADIANGLLGYIVGCTLAWLWDTRGRRWARKWRNRIKPYYDD